MLTCILFLSGCFLSDRDLAPEGEAIDATRLAWPAKGGAIIARSTEAFFFYPNPDGTIGAHMMDSAERVQIPLGNVTLYPHAGFAPSDANSQRYIAGLTTVDGYTYFGVEVGGADQKTITLYGLSGSARVGTWDDLKKRLRHAALAPGVTQDLLTPVSAAEKADILGWPPER